MSKLALPLLGAGGVGVSCGGGYLLLKDRESSEVQTKQEKKLEVSDEENQELQKRKYPRDAYGYYVGDTMLDIEDTPDHIGGYRFSDLKQGDPNGSEKGEKTVHHPKLKEAILASSSDEQKARALHKEACQEMFGAKYEEVSFSVWDLDVRKYCFGKLRDGVGGSGTWSNHDKDGWRKKIRGLLGKDFSNFGGSDQFKDAWFKLKAGQDMSDVEVQMLNEQCSGMGDLPFGKHEHHPLGLEIAKNVCLET